MMKKMTDGDWCHRCWHCITWSAADSRWLHVSNEDWSGDSCPCAGTLTACSPRAPRHRGPLPQRKRACGPAPGYASGNNRQQGEQ